jgi:hypothetical protein
MTSIKTKLTATLILAGGALGLGSGLARADVGAMPAMDHRGGQQHATRIVGQSGALTIQNGVLGGLLAGGAYDVRVAADGARGTGPRGPIEIRLDRVDGGYEVTGIWNGGRVHFVVGEKSVRGRATRPLPAGDSVICNYDMARTGNGRSYAGTSLCMGGYRAGHLEIHPQAPAELTEAQNVVLLVAYLTATGAPARI